MFDQLKMMIVKLGPITKTKIQIISTRYGGTKLKVVLYSQSALQQKKKRKIKEKERVYLNSTIFINDSFN